MRDKVTAKAVAAIESADDDRFGANGGFSAILSTPSLDRDGDRLGRTEWMEPLPDRLPLDVDHGMSVQDTIGSFHPYWDGEKMMMDAFFASTPKAQEVRTLVKEGHISSVSVAFMTDKSKKDGEPRRELLNAGIVAIPSNRDAVIFDAKAAGGVGGDGALTQAIHDASVHLGALCVPAVPEDSDPTGADDGANKGVDEASVTVSWGEHSKSFTTDEAAAGDVQAWLKSVIEVVDVATSESISVEMPEGMTMEQFQAALQQVLNPQSDSPVETPADEAAAASLEEPAPAEDEAAVEAAEEAVVDDPDKRARDMLMTLFATQNL